MPAAIPILLSTLVTAGVGTGITALEGGFSSGPSAGSQEQAAEAQAKADADKQAKAEAAAKAQALRLAAPNAQAQTGGSLTDAPFASLTQSIAGEPGNIQEALRALGLNSDTSQSQSPGITMSGGN